MSDPRLPEPNGFAKESKLGAVSDRLRCPNCGREPAIVFPLVRDRHQALGEAPLVCMKCCLDRHDRL
jgi:hypothetical protein